MTDTHNLFFPHAALVRSSRSGSRILRALSLGAWLSVLCNVVPTGASAPVSTDERTTERVTERSEDATHQTYYISTTGDNEHDGLSPERAWKSLQHAANRVRQGDTVLIGGGRHPGTVYFRHTGEPGEPITFKAMPGERVVIDGLQETLTVGFVLYEKHCYRFDGLYFEGYAGIEDNVGASENGAICIIGGSDIRITRCHFSNGWGPGLVASRCSDMLIKNCVFMHSMNSVFLRRCPGAGVENNVFINSLIAHLLGGGERGKPICLINNIFGENTRGKVHIAFVRLGAGTIEKDNCFYTRWPEAEREVINDLTLPEYQAQLGDDGSFARNPKLAGAIGFHRGSGPRFENQDFDGLFSTDPYTVQRGVGLQPEAFRGFHFWRQDWPYDKAWAVRVLATVETAENLERAGKDVEAMAAYTELADETSMPKQLQAEFLDRAAVCADKMGDYDKAMDLARQIPDVSPSRLPINESSILRQMALMVENAKGAELLQEFGNLRALKDMSWNCPDNEIPLANAFYCRSLAYAQTGDLESAERELMTVIEKGKKYGYQPGATVLDLTWKRLGDFYRTQTKDDAKALEAYKKVISRTTVIKADREHPKSPLLGNSEVLVAATEAACDILRNQGKRDAARKLEEELAKAQADARNAAKPLL